jgi:hypothetical protein
MPRDVRANYTVSEAIVANCVCCPERLYYIVSNKRMEARRAFLGVTKYENIFIRDSSLCDVDLIVLKCLAFRR